MRGRPWWTLLAILALVAPTLPASGGDRMDDAGAAKFLTRVTFGATPDAILVLESMGKARWVEAALHPERDDRLEARLAGFTTLKMTPIELKANYPFLPANGDGVARRPGDRRGRWPGRPIQRRAPQSSRRGRGSARKADGR